MSENSNNFDGLLEPVETGADEQFYQRADEFIALANELSDASNGDEEFANSAAKVSASLMYANARFNIWLTACGYNKAEDLKANKEQILNYFLEQYKLMLEDNFEEYSNNFEEYMNPPEDEVKRFV